MSDLAAALAGLRRDRYAARGAPAVRSRALAVALLVTLLAVGWVGGSGSEALTALAVQGPVGGSEPSRVVHVMYTALNGLQSVIWVAEERGLFRAAGLTVTVERAEANLALASLNRGDVQAVDLGGPPAINAAARGLPIRFIAADINSPVFDLVASSSIHTPQQLKGKVVAIDRPSTLSDIATRLVLGHLGLHPGRDVQLLSLGSAGVRLAAMTSGQIQAALLDPGQAQRVLGSKVNVLLSYRQLTQVPLLSDVLITTPAFLQAHLDTIRRFLEADLEAIAAYKDRRNESAIVPILGKYLRLHNAQALQNTYRIYAELLEPRPVVHESVFQSTVRVMEQTMGQPLHVEPAALIDNGPLTSACARVGCK